MKAFRVVVNYMENGTPKHLVVHVTAQNDENAAYTVNQYLLSISVGDYTANFELLKGVGIYEGQDFGVC